MDYYALGQQMREHRKRLRHTQADVAFMAGLSVSFYGHLERGTRKASIETLLSIARVLKTTPDALLGIGCVYDEPMPSSVMECVHSMRSQLDQIEAYYGTKSSRKKRARAYTGEVIP